MQVSPTSEIFIYSVKIINPNDKGGYRVEQLQTKYSIRLIKPFDNQSRAHNTKLAFTYLIES